MIQDLSGGWKTFIYFRGCVIVSVSAVQEEGDGDRAAAEQNRDDVAEQPAAGGRTETPGGVAGAGCMEGKAETSPVFDRHKSQ